MRPHGAQVAELVGVRAGPDRCLKWESPTETDTTVVCAIRLKAQVQKHTINRATNPGAVSRGGPGRRLYVRTECRPHSAAISITDTSLEP
jgi:hypothetical protein